MTNSKKVLQFIQILSLYINANVSIKNALQIVGGMTTVNTGIRKAAKEIYGKMEEGISLSSAIKSCENIQFPETFSSFFEIAQETGKITETVNFLENVEAEKNDNKNELLTISLYPVFVLILALVLSVFLYKYSYMFSLSAEISKSVFIESSLFLIFSTLICFFVIKEIFADGIMLNLINALFFLISSGTDIKTSLEITMSFAQEKRSLEKRIIHAIDEIENGKNMAEAVSFLSKNNKYIFEIENTCGNLSRSLKNILQIETQKRSRKIKRAKALCEPVMILIVSIYILIIAKGLIMPLLFNYSILM